MDALGTLLPIILIALAVFVVAGFIGFKIPAPLDWAGGERTGEVARRDLPPDLPPTARRWLGDAPAPDSVVAWGRGSIASSLPLIGRVWLPLSWALYLAPGPTFILRERITWFGRTFIRGGEEYRDGKGGFLLGSQRPLEAPYLDQTERTPAWLYFLWLAPARLLETEGVSLQPTPDGNLEWRVAQPDPSELVFKLEFEPEDGTLRTITTTRKGSRSGEDYPYRFALSRPQALSEEIGPLPTHLVASWEQDVYLKLDLVGLRLNQDLSETLPAGIRPD